MTGLRTDWLVSADLAPDAADPWLAPFYAATARGTLTLPVCGNCRLALELEQRVCDECGGSNVAWAEIEPTGTVHASTLVHRLEPGLIVADAPYPVVDVQLSSGHRLIMTTVERTGEQPSVGTPVRIAFRSVGGVAVPAAQPSENQSSLSEVHS